MLTGSRAAGTADAASDYDVVWVLTDAAFARVAGELGRQVRDGRVERIHESPERLARLAETDGWFRGSFVGARVLLDRDGELERLVGRLATYPPEEARRIAFEAYDDYLNGVVRSLRAWQKRNELGARLHASASLAALSRALHALEGGVAPYLDRLAFGALAGQGWGDGELEGAFLALARTADARLQQELQRRVEALMESRGIRAHDDWGEQLQRLKRASF